MVGSIFSFLILHVFAFVATRSEVCADESDFDIAPIANSLLQTRFDIVSSSSPALATARGPSAKSGSAAPPATRKALLELLKPVQPWWERWGYCTRAQAAIRWHCTSDIPMCYATGWGFVVLAVVGSVCMRSTAPERKQRFAGTGTEAITGFRVFLAIWVVTEHAGLHNIPAGGSFVVLSGVVFGVSRRTAPGVARDSIDSVPAYLKFQFLRLSRLLPLYWFYRFTTMNQLSTPSGGGIHDKLYFIFSELFLLNLPAWMGDNHLGHLWFVRVMLVIYLLYPVLERVALGPQSARPAAPSRGYALFAACCLAKILTCALMLRVDKWDHANWYGWAYMWHGHSLYADPILRIPDFMLGLLIPHLAMPEFAWFPVATDVLGVVAVFLTLISPPQTTTSASTMFYFMNLEAPFVALFMWGLCFAPEHSPLGRFFSLPWLVNAGEWGYGVYLFHPEVLVFASQQTASKSHYLCSIPAVIVFVFLQSWATFTVIEMPTMRFARQIVASCATRPDAEDTVDAASHPCKPLTQ